MKIAFVVPGMGMGGAERVISILAKGFIEKGHYVCIGMFNVTPQTVAYSLDSRIEVENITSYRFGSPKEICKSLKNIEEYLTKVAPDVVISFTNVTCAQVSIVCKKMHIPIIFSERNDPRRLLTGMKTKIFQKILIHNVKNMVFQTNGAKDLYPESITKHSVIILNPLDTTKFPPYYEGERKKEIVTVGRLEPQKRQDILIRAFSIIAEHYPDYKLRIYGEGSQKDFLLKLIRELNMESRIILMGTKKNIFDQINESAIFAMTSDFEGLSNALIEAMALGIPCVSTRCSPGGAEELIRDKKNGFLVPCGDYNELSKVLDMMIKNYKDTQKIGQAAVAIKSRVEVQGVINAWNDYICEVVGNK